MYKKMWFAIANSLIWIAFVIGGYVQSVESIDPSVQLADLSTVQPMDSVCKSILSDVRAGKTNPSMTPGQMAKCADTYPWSSTAYEELTGCAYLSVLGEFKCQIKIKQKYDYNEYEYVAVFVDGRKVGTGSVYVEDCPLPSSRHPSDCERPSYIKVIIPSHRSSPTPEWFLPRQPVRYDARAILSWQDPNITYGTIPIWGNVINFPFWVYPPSCKLPPHCAPTY